MKDDVQVKTDEQIDLPTDYQELAAELQKKVSNLEQTVKVYEKHYSILAKEFKKLEKKQKGYKYCMDGIVAFIKMLDQQLNENNEDNTEAE